MKLPFALLLFGIFYSTCACSQINDTLTNEVFTIVEEMPDFKGGQAEMLKFLQKNLNYPEVAKEKEKMGTVYVTFVVDTNGGVENITILKGVGYGLDEEAKRVIKLMDGKWSPGKQNGQKVRVQFNVPIKFSLITGDDNVSFNNNSTFIDGPLKNGSYVYDDSVQKAFYSSNKVRVQDLNRTIEKLPIDRCHYGNIIMFIYIDSLGKTVDAEVLKGTSSQRMDSIIRQTVINYPGLWRPARNKNKPISFKGKFSFILSNLTTVTSTERKQTNYAIIYTQTKQLDYIYNCKDNDFYYNKGVNEFKNNNYAKAVGYFSQALDANPFDMDALFNLGISYLKRNNFEKACDCFSKGADYGDKVSKENLQKYCGDKGSK